LNRVPTHTRYDFFFLSISIFIFFPFYLVSWFF
jgi:hypothetical protein